jgi:hypothetical protein
MSNNPEKSNFGTTSHIAELEINWKSYGRFVRNSDHTLEIELENEVLEITEPGIYKLISKAAAEIYVGEAKNLSKRLSNYKNAGYVPNARLEFTNRRVQGWMLDLIADEKGPIEIFVCNEAPYLCQDGKKLQLDLGGETNGKYNRELIEHMEIANNANKFRIQNDPCNWERNKEKCTSGLNNSLKLANC